MQQSPAKALTQFLKLRQQGGPLPILWVGAGASAAAGLPTLASIDKKLQQALPGSTSTGFELIEEFVKEYSRADLSNQLETLLGGTHKPVGLHESMARLAGVGLFAAIFTTNYDELIEDALKTQGIHYVPQVLEQNFILQARKDLHVLKLHGSRTDWKSVILSGGSYNLFAKTYQLLHNQLAHNLLTHPVVFVGCSMKDPRVVDWLRSLTPEARGGLYGGRVLITSSDWARLTHEEKELYASANIKPVEVEGFAAIAEVLAGVARELAPLMPAEFIFDITPGEDTWTVVGPTPESPPRAVPNPLAQMELLSQLTALRELSSQPVMEGAPESKVLESRALQVAREIGRRLTEMLLSAEARAQVLKGLHQTEGGRARLTVRVRAGEQSDQALALPWELLMPQEGGFAVEDMRLDLVREAMVEGAPTLDEPTGPLSLAVTVAAPEDQAALRYEDEAFRLHQSLVPSGHRVVFSELGDVEDLVRTAAMAEATAIHFSGHGLPGSLVFEDEFGASKAIAVDELVRRLREQLTPSGGARRLPKLFFLASCHGASVSAQEPEDGGPDSKADARSRELRKALDKGPSTAAALHRCGFVQVIGYFGPISDRLCTRSEERFYEALAQGETTLQAVARARASLREPVEAQGVRLRHPLAWMQLAFYHRGPDKRLALPGRETARAKAPRLIRKESVTVNRLPVLEFGFIGRRALQHLARRKVRDGQRLIVLQGLGGLGKTALASHLVRNVFAPDSRDALIVTCQELGVEGANPIEALWAQVEEHGRSAQVARWDEQVRELREARVEPDVGFEQTVRLLWRARPKLVLYADNTETLQVGPEDEEPRALGSWHPKAHGWWQVMERLAEDGLLVMASTRYRWAGMKPEAWLPIEPMREVDSLRMIESFERLGRLPHALQARLAEMVDGHPRTVEYLDTLVGERMSELEKTLEEMGDAWAELIEPILPKQAGRLTANLLLDELWKRLSERARTHARTLSVLRLPAPRPIIEQVGSETVELMRAGMLTRFREQVRCGERVEWVDRWGMHSLVARFVQAEVEEATRRAAHQAVGHAYADWVRKPGALWLEMKEGIFHLHEAGEGDSAWWMIDEYIAWLRNAARYQEALSVLERCERAGTSGEHLASALGFIGEMKLCLGDASEVVWEEFARALQLTKSEQLRVFLLTGQGELRNEQGRYRDAEELLRQALIINKKAPGVEHPSYGSTLQSLARVLNQQGKYEEAEGLLRQALVINAKTLGVEHPSYGGTLHALAGVLNKQGKYEEAEGLLRKTLAIDEKALGVKHPSYGATLHALAGVLSQQGKYGDAEELLRKALAIVKDALGVKHPSYGAALQALAEVLSQQGNDGDAEELLCQARAIAEKALELEHPSLCPILHNLGLAVAAQRRLSEGVQYVQHALRIARDSHGEHHPETAKILSLLAQLQAASRVGEAQETARLALDSLKHSLGLEHPVSSALAPELLAIRDGVGSSQFSSSGPEAEALNRLMRGVRALESGDFQGAVNELTLVVESATGQEEPLLAANACGFLAAALFKLNRRADALARAHQGLRLAEQLKQPELLSQLRALAQELEAAGE